MSIALSRPRRSAAATAPPKRLESEMEIVICDDDPFEDNEDFDSSEELSDSERFVFFFSRQ